MNHQLMNPVKGDVVRFQNISNSPHGRLLCIKNEAKTVPGPCKRYRPIRYVKHWAPASCVRPLVRFICTRNACTYRAARFLCFLFQQISVLSWSQLHYWLLRLRPVSVPLRPTTPPLALQLGWRALAYVALKTTRRVLACVACTAPDGSFTLLLNRRLGSEEKQESE